MKARISKVGFAGLMAMALSTAQAADLEELFNITFNQDPRIRIAESEAKIAEAVERQNLGGLLPQISASSSHSRNRREVFIDDAADDPEYYDGETYSLVIQQPLFDMARFERYQASEARTQASEAAFKDTLGSVGVDLVDRYFKVLAAEDNIELVITERQAIEKQLEQVRSRYERQLAVITDVLEVEARLDSILANEVAAKNEVAITREALAEVVGKPVYEKLSPVVANIDFTLEGTMQHWVDKTLANNSALKSRKKAIEAAQYDLGQAKSEHYPTASWVVSARKSDTGNLNENTRRNETYYTALQFNVPLYSGGTTSARVEESQYRVEIAKQQAEEIRRAVLRQLRASYLTTQASLKALSAAAKALTSASKSLEAREQAFKFGTVTVVDVLDSLRDKFRAERDYKAAQYSFILSYAQLLNTAQADPHEGVQKLNNWLVNP